MAKTIRTIMTEEPRTVDAGSTLVDAAKTMKQADIGDVIVTENGKVCGIVTDRDITVRAVAENRDPRSTRVAEICSAELTTLAPDQSIDDAVALMRKSDVRRLPVVEDGRAVGIVSLGDLAVERDPDSALADISAASPNT
jgi:CBS domain-containing protein